MKKWKKFVLILVTILTLTVSLALPSFAYTIDSTGSIDYDVYAYGALFKQSAQGPGMLKVATFTEHEDIDLTALPDNNLDTFYFTLSFRGMSNGAMTDSYMLLTAWNYVDRTITTSTSALGGKVTVSCTIEGKKIKDLTLTTSGVTVFEGSTSCNMTLQVFPFSSTLESDYKSIINGLDTEDKADLLYQIEELEGNVSSLNSQVNELNKTVSSQNKEILDLSFEKVQNNNKIKEQEETILDLREGMENNNALFSLFNGIGSGIFAFVNPFFSLSIGGITVGAMIAFICALVLMYFLIKIIVKAFGN